MKALTEYWLKDQNAERMWESWKDQHRVQILNALSCIPPFESVYEIGCGSGPNLRLIKHYRPEVVVGGCESNIGLAAWASDHLSVAIESEPLPTVPTTHTDVMISCYTMAYVNEVDVVKVLENAQARNFIIFEPTAHIVPFGPPGVYADTTFPTYAHDYLEIAWQTGWDVLWRWPHYPHHMGLNVVLTLERIK